MMVFLDKKNLAAAFLTVSMMIGGLSAADDVVAPDAIVETTVTTEEATKTSYTPTQVFAAHLALDCLLEAGGDFAERIEATEGFDKIGEKKVTETNKGFNGISIATALLECAALEGMHSAGFKSDAELSDKDAFMQSLGSTFAPVLATWAVNRNIDIKEGPFAGPENATKYLIYKLCMKALRKKVWSNGYKFLSPHLPKIADKVSRSLTVIEDLEKVSAMMDVDKGKPNFGKFVSKGVTKTVINVASTFVDEIDALEPEHRMDCAKAITTELLNPFMASTHGWINDAIAPGSE